MKNLVLFLLLFPTCGLCDFSSSRFTKEKDAKYSQQATIIFDGTIALERWQFQDKDGFYIDLKYPENVESERYSQLLEIITHRINRNARYANYLVSFKVDEIIKGNTDSVGNLKWNYRNSYRSMCPHHPAELIRGSKFRFYIVRIIGKDDKRITDLKYLLLPDDAEQDGAEQPATAPESKSQGKEKPKPETEGRSQ